MEFRMMNNQASSSNSLTTNIDAMRSKLNMTASAPADAPWGLPGNFYTDQAFFEYECATLLKSSWHCVGRADELLEIGDYITLNLLSEPLIIVRDQSGIKALSNVCRHRGMRLAEGTGNTKRFVCPYHAWM